MILALNIEDSDGKKIDTKETAVAELIRLALPCMDKASRALGMHEEALDQASKAAIAIADHPEKAQALFRAGITVFQGSFDQEALVGIIEALEIEDSEGGKVNTREKAVLKLVELAVPCMKKYLRIAGMDEDVVGKLTTNVLPNAQQICKAAMPLLRGDLHLDVFVNFVLALQIEDFKGRRIDSKEKAVAEVLRLAVPCMEKRFKLIGFSNQDVEALAAAANAVADNEAHARVLCLERLLFYITRPRSLMSTKRCVMS